MKGYVAKRRDRFYAVVYEGLDPVTGQERRSWHPAGTDRAEAEQLAERLAAERLGRNDEVRSLSFGAYLTTQWLTAKRIELAVSTYRDYERKTTNHVLPSLGRTREALEEVTTRNLSPRQAESLMNAAYAIVDAINNRTQTET